MNKHIYFFKHFAWLSLVIINIAAIKAEGLGNVKGDLKKKWPKADAVILSYDLSLRFSIDQISGKPVAKQYEEVHILDLKSRPIERFYNYDDNTSIIDFSIKDKNGRKVRPFVTEGSMEIEGIFHSDAKFKHYKWTTNKPDQSYVFKIKQQTSDLRYLTKVYLADPIYPVEKLKVKVVVPDWLDLDIIPFKFKHFDVTIDTTSTSDEKIFTYTIRDVSTVGDNDGFLSLANSYAHLLMLPRSYHDKIDNPIIRNIDDLYDFYQSLVGTLNPDTSIIAPLVSEVLQDAKNEKDSINQIYNWVQDNIRYLAFEDGIAGFKPDEAHLVYSKKYGDCKGMANLLKVMLNVAGFDARLAWIGTKHLIYDYSTPSLAVDNHMICFLNYDDVDYYLDATQKQIPLGRNSDIIQGKQVLIEDGSTFFLNTIPVSEAYDNLVSSRCQMKLENEKISGHLMLNYKGASKDDLSSVLTTIKTTDQDRFIKEVVIGNDGLNIDSLNYTGYLSKESDIDIGSFVTVNGAVSTFGDEMYIDIDFLTSEAKHQIDTVNCYHYYIANKKAIESTIELSLDGKWEISYQPENASYKQGAFSYDISYAYINQTIVYKRKLIVDTSMIEKADFDTYNKFMAAYHKQRRQSIVLKQLK